MTENSLSPFAGTGALASLEADARDLLARSMRPLKLPAGRRVFSPGDSCTGYFIVRSGQVRVSTSTESGREIVLYRVAAGETCVLTAACLMSGAAYDAEATVEEDVEAVFLGKPVFTELLAVSPRFRDYVFSSYGERLGVLIGLIQEIAMRHVDRRLARLIVSRAPDGTLAMTHQAVANELNSAREVVTRLLHDFVERGWISLARGQITVLDSRSLSAFADTV